MELLYQTDSYAGEIDTVIEAVNGGDNSVRFAQTIVYPGGGGQPYDIGMFEHEGESHAITGSKKTDGELWYLLDRIPPLTGMRVRLKIDWERRYALMRTHTCMHILCGVIWRDYGKAVTGGNMEPLKARMDFEFDGLDHDLLQEIERKINEEVRAEREIRVFFTESREELESLIRTKTNLIPDGVERIRIVDIDGLDRQADGGTHCANTRETGTIRITGFENKGKSNKRIKVEISHE